jgi:queuine tRNA-ribosyltransferase
MAFEVLATEGFARAGELTTLHGTVPTPAFFPVATQGTVKGILPEELRASSVHGLLANAYHLWLRPGTALIEQAGGLHQFMGWDRPIITDSGGFQVFSLSELRQIDEDGVTFTSHIDATEHRLSPELAIAVQSALGSDVAMVLDICAPYPCPRDELKGAAERTVRWAERCVAAERSNRTQVFPIVQGGMEVDLREWCAARLAELPVVGYGIGGLSVGEPRSATWPALDASLASLPAQRARYLMGVGAPADLVEGIARGVDVFDCVLPTRLGRHGTVLSASGRLNLKTSGLSERSGPIDPDCDCLACTTYSVSVLHHLVRVGDPLGMRLASIHNIRHLVRLVESARQAILSGHFSDFRHRWAEAQERRASVA